ncbi:magnetosome protein MamT [Magnetovibrio sp. PR-2]|uniref:magnetosome protein MamT n=1 Tax=Magnetovibrio sp. PR-2 TaxID=3120356 RepID=UPI002FCE4E5E
MALWEQFKRKVRGKEGLSLLILFVIGGLVWETFGLNLGSSPSHQSVRITKGILYGDMPAPAERGLVETLKDTFVPDQKYKLMTLKHIPRVTAQQKMPHPYVGVCTNCHLYVDGPGPGTQFKTPVGAALESLSRIKKLGPPLLPDSDRPHPPAGRCIKCHDVVIKVPIEKKKGGFRWVM